MQFNTKADAPWTAGVFEYKSSKTQAVWRKKTVPVIRFYAAHTESRAQKRQMSINVEKGLWMFFFPNLFFFHEYIWVEASLAEFKRKIVKRNYTPKNFDKMGKMLKW